MNILNYKAKKIEGGDWVNGNLVMVCDGNTLRRYPSIVISYDFETFDWHDAIPETICHSTGITDKNGVEIFGDDLRRGRDGRIFRIYEMPGGFAIKAGYWGGDISDLLGSDFLIMEGLTDAQTRDWIINSTEAAGNYHDNK